MPASPSAPGGTCGFFEDLGHLQRLGALQAETVWNSFGSLTRTYWSLCKPAIEKMREERKVPDLYEEFEHVRRVLADLEHERGIESPRKNSCAKLWKMRPSRAKSLPHDRVTASGQAQLAC